MKSVRKKVYGNRIIVITGQSTSLNCGGMGMILGFTRSLENSFQESKIFLLSNNSKLDQRRYALENIEIVQRSWVRAKDRDFQKYLYTVISFLLIVTRAFLYRLAGVLHLESERILESTLSVYVRSNVVVDINGDCWSRHFDHRFFPWLLPLVLHGVDLTRSGGIGLALYYRPVVLFSLFLFTVLPQLGVARITPDCSDLGELERLE